jgi:DNA-binding GntR family transcriptional regulator
VDNIVPYDFGNGSNSPGGNRDKEDPLKLLIPVHLKDNAAPYYIASILREAIYRGILAEGEALYQSQLAERLAVSPIPLREALRLLERDGLVNFHGRRGAIVTGLSMENVQEIYEMMLFLETGLMRIAFPLITPADIDVAERLLDEMEAQTDFMTWGGQNALFHAALYEPAHRYLTLDRIERLRRQVDRYIRVHMESIREEAQREHRRILEAVRAGNLPEVTEALTFHLERASELLQSHMKARETTERRNFFPGED